MTDDSGPQEPDCYYIADFLGALVSHDAQALRRAKSRRTGDWPWSPKHPDPDEYVKQAVLTARWRLRDTFDRVDNILAKYDIDG